jgi:arylsulfatase A-like enzyme/Xaa-Pro aminopeptidase
MNVRSTVQTLGLTASMLLAVGAGSARPETLPYIVIILADDLGYGDVGVYNPKAAFPTPNLDKMASDGMLFTDAHSPATVCTPTRYSLQTGRMAFRTGYSSVFEGPGGPSLIEPTRLTIAGMLRESGYTTALYGKWHIGLTWVDSDGRRIEGQDVAAARRIDYELSTPLPDGPVHRGYDYFFGTPNCPTTDPLYVYIDQDQVPVPATGLLNKETLPDHPFAWDNDRGMVAPGYLFEEADLLFLEKSLGFMRDHRKRSPDAPFFLVLSTQAAHAPSFPAPEFKGRTSAGPHGDFIFELDAIVGRVLGALADLGIDDDTLVMFSSDNGPEVRNTVLMRENYDHDAARPWRGMKRDGWEGGHRVPFIARWPGRIAPGSVSDQTMTLTDVMATVASIVGVALPDDAAEDSYDMLPVLLGLQDEDEPVRPYTLTQSTRGQLQIRRGPWKYLDHRGSGGNNYARRERQRYQLPEREPGAPGQLYNLDDDPGETTNLYYKRPDIVKELQALLEETKSSGRSAPLGRSPLSVSEPPEPRPLEGERGVSFHFQTDFPPEEFQARRARVFESIGEKGLALLQGAPSVRGSTAFRQTNSFYYLSGVEVPHAYLLLDGRRKRTVLYLPHRDERRERSEGKVLSAEDAVLVEEITGIDAVRPIERLGRDLVGPLLRPPAPALYTLLSPAQHGAESRDGRLIGIAGRVADPWDGRPSREGHFVHLLRTRYPQLPIRDLTPILDELRHIKSAREIGLIRRASEIAGLGIMEAMRSTRAGLYEYQLAAAARYVFLANGARGEGYHPITASGTNAFFGHYHRNDAILRDGDLVLMDYAPDYRYYTSDVTRLWPVSGEFTREQRPLYGFIAAYRDALLKRIRPGVTPDEILDAAREDMRGVLESTEFAKPSHEQAARDALDFRGHLSHPVGMAVHDVGRYRGRLLEPGLVFSVDPMMWVRDERLYIRVEDVVAVTEEGVENFTWFVPTGPDEIEALQREEGVLQKVPPVEKSFAAGR